MSHCPGVLGHGTSDAVEHDLRQVHPRQRAAGVRAEAHGHRLRRRHGSDTATAGTEPLLGTATTPSDGTLTLTVPPTLPANVKQAMDDNGGALNLNATTTATTTGVQVLGADTLTAVPEQSKTALAAGTDASAQAAEAPRSPSSEPTPPTPENS
jgi:erythromycin esterase-like protein